MDSARSAMVSAGAEDNVTDAVMSTNIIACLRGMPETAFKANEWKFSATVWKTENKKTPLSWDTLKSRIEEELKTIAEHEALNDADLPAPVAPRPLTHTPSGILGRVPHYDYLHNDVHYHGKPPPESATQCDFPTVCRDLDHDSH